MWLGVALQVLGTIIAGVALVLEWRSESRIMARELKDDRERRVNPWKVTLRARYRAPRSSDRTSHQRQRFGYSPDPDAQAVTKFVRDHLAEREALLAADWKSHAAADQAMRDDPVHLFNEQARVLAEQQSRIRRRVMWEMFGLLLVVVGTTISSLAAS